MITEQTIEAHRSQMALWVELITYYAVFTGIMAFYAAIGVGLILLAKSFIK